MKERRKFLQVMPLAVFGATALGLTGKSGQALANGEHARDGNQPIDPRIQRSVPDVPGVDHTGKAFRFYLDLVKDKVVAINFMSIRDDARFPVTAHMAEIARRLGDKLGRDVFLISVTRDPSHDTPERLAEFAERYSVPAGWLFVNCAADGSAALHSRIYHAHEHSAPSAGTHDAAAPHAFAARTTDTVFYGNGGVGVWSNFAITLHPDEAVRHISWVMPGKKPVGEPRRAGPRSLAGEGRSSDNRIA